jgi:putative heme utilization carrier protein HutX
MASVDDLIRQDLAARPDGILEAVAEERDVPMQAVLDCLGPESAQRVPGTRFEEIWQDLTGWGEITFVVHTRDGVFECKGCVPPGTLGRGYFNIHVRLFHRPALLRQALLLGAVRQRGWRRDVQGLRRPQ